jgi:hypothetical protein
MNLSRSLVGRRALFVALALADLLMTSYLLGAAPEQFYESNPVARWCLSHGGWAGLAGFKVATVLLALAAVAVVARRRPRVAGCVLRLACGATALVVVYICGLAFVARDLPSQKALTEQGRRIDEQLRPVQAYCRVMDRLTKDLCSVPCAVGEAVACFAATNHTGSRAWSATLRDQYPGNSDAERLAALLLDRPALKTSRCSDNSLPLPVDRGRSNVRGCRLLSRARVARGQRHLVPQLLQAAHQLPRRPPLVQAVEVVPA